ncbi:MAG: NAD-dependent epimerase/dehydratase family protein [Pseudomonadota bacterium]
MERTPDRLPRGAKILVTGGTGHLGAALVHELVEGGHPQEGIRVAFLPGTTTAALVDLPGLELFPADLLDLAEVWRALRGITHVFHVAGNTSFHPGRRRVQWMVNVEATRNICEACLASDTVERLVHTGTVNVLGIPDPQGTLGDEDTLPWGGKRRIHSFASPAEALALADQVHVGTAPKDWWRGLRVGYLDSKLTADLLVERFVRERGLPAVRVLPGTCFGPYDRLVGNGLYLLKLRAGGIPAVTPGTGLPCAHVRDVARGHILAMVRGGVGERYIVSGREEDNLYLPEMLRVMAEVLREKEPGRAVRLPRWRVPTTAAWLAGAVSEAAAALARRPPLLTRAAVLSGSFPSFYTSAKARRELDYRPATTFRQAVAEQYDDWAACGMLGAKGRAVDSP